MLVNKITIKRMRHYYLRDIDFYGYKNLKFSVIFNIFIGLSRFFYTKRLRLKDITFTSKTIAIRNTKKLPSWIIRSITTQSKLVG